MAKRTMKKNAKVYKARFDINKASFVRHMVGDHVLLKNEERHQTKLDPKLKGPLAVAEVLQGDRYKLKALNNNRTYKYSHEFLGFMPERRITTVFDDEDVENANDQASEGCDLEKD